MYVSIRNKTSKTYRNKCGLPQGGTLAPIVFILFINDIVNSSSIFDFAIYADDTCLMIGLKRSEFDETAQSNGVVSCESIIGKLCK